MQLVNRAVGPAGLEDSLAACPRPPRLPRGHAVAPAGGLGVGGGRDTDEREGLGQGA